MSTTIDMTPEAFMAAPSSAEDDLEESQAALHRVTALPPDPLESIAASLGLIATYIGNQQVVAEADAELQQRYDRLDQAYEQLARDFDGRQQVIEKALELLKKSTSKLAIGVREVLESRDPDKESELTTVLPVRPADDADVEEWRAYARPFVPRSVDVDDLNRSQIRTLLGIAHPEA